MMLAVPYFGHSARFAGLLRHWFRLYHESGTDIPAVVVTDIETPMPLSCYTVRVDLAPLAGVIRHLPGSPHQAFDRKGALLLAGAQHLPGNVLFLDSDAFVTRDPAPMLSAMSPEALALRADLWQPGKVVLRWNDYETVPMQNAGVVFVGAQVCRRTLVEDYREQFRRLALDHADNCWLEQFTWSVLWHEYGRAELDVRLNWAHLQPGDPANAAIYHAHGDAKWRMTGL